MKLREKISGVIYRVGLFISDLIYLTTTLDRLERDNYELIRRVDELEDFTEDLKAHVQRQARQTKREL